MVQVTIEGTEMPSDRLGRGRRAKVELTDDIRKLVKIGAVRIVDKHGPSDESFVAGTDTEADYPTVQPTPDPLPEQTWSPGDDPVLPDLPESAYGPDSTPLAPVVPAIPDATLVDVSEPKLPARNGLTADWKAWVAAKVPGTDVESKNRDELIAIWDHYGERLNGE